MWTAPLLGLFALAPLQSPLDPPTLRVVCFGDSSTYQRRDTQRAWPARLDDLLTAALEGCRIEVENAGRPGDTTAHALARLERDVLGRDPDLVLVQFGVNDAAVELPKGASAPAVSLADYRANLESLVERIEARGATVALLEPGAATWTPEIRAGYGRAPYLPEAPWGFDHLLAEYAAVVAELATTRELPLVPVHQADRARGPEVTSRWRTDGRHPTDEAHAWLAGEAAALVLAALERGAAAPRPLSAHAAVSRGFTIPQVDLTARPTTRVDDAAAPALGPPTLIATAAGDVLCAYPQAAPGGAQRVAVRRSRDGGATWELAPAPAGVVAARAALTLSRAGDTLLLWSDRFPVQVARSSDGGASWSPLRAAGDPPWGGQGVAAGTRVAPDGARITWLFDDGTTRAPGATFDGFEVLEARSRDGGRRWSTAQRILRDDRAYLAFPCPVDAAGGTLLLCSELGRQTNSQVFDIPQRDGEWGPGRDVAGALTGTAHRAEALTDGRLVIAFVDRGLDTPSPGAAIAWVGRPADLVTGRQGTRRLRLFPGPGARPAVAAARAGVVFAALVGEPGGRELRALRVEDADL